MKTLIICLIVWVVLMASVLFYVGLLNKVTVGDDRIWCCLYTASSIDEVVLEPGQVIIYTRGGVDIMEKCK